ncbi:hypothetical protein M3B90_05150 [Dermabacter sp. p3-SID358]|uniref:hypothetical protein n=1 Tax=Dermabacter sp. p3-SID358 TaxID=2916114 RepID=UPI0021A5104A|nr:hypothetical protein [Dermabacter sp. p3-SID358]MCT1866908.1 hypothetical protein [Dermabacter sp. p3-SID358]
MTASKPTVADPRIPARVWIVLASIALVCALSAPIAPPVFMALFPFHVPDPPGTHSPLGGLNDIVAHIFVAALIFTAFLGAGNLAGLTAIPFAITALTRLERTGRMWFAAAAIIFFVVGPLLEVASAVTLVGIFWNLPSEVAMDPATGTVRVEWEGIKSMLFLGAFIVPLAIDLVRFAVMVFAGFVAYDSELRPAPRVSIEAGQPSDLPARHSGTVELRTSPFT